MKRRFTLAAIALLAVMALLRVCGCLGETKARRLTLSFAGGTNSEGRLATRFWVTNGDVASIWHFVELSRKTGSNWIAEPVPAIPIAKTVPDQGNFPPLINQPHLAQLIDFPAGDPFAPVRLILQCQERSSCLGGARDSLLQYYRQRVERRSVLVLNGRSYFVTNEWIPAIPMAAPPAKPPTLPSSKAK